MRMFQERKLFCLINRSYKSLHRLSSCMSVNKKDNQTFLSRNTQNVLSPTSTKIFSTSSVWKNNDFISYFLRKKTLDEIMASDGVRASYELVLQSTSINYVRWSGFFIVLSNLGILSILLADLTGIYNFNMIYNLMSSPLSSALVFSFNFLCCASLLYFQKCYPIRIYYSEEEDNFVAIMPNFHPLKTHNLNIKPGTVEMKTSKYDVEILHNFNEVLLHLPSQRIYLNPSNFQFPTYYNKLLGYDKLGGEDNEKDDF